MPSVRTREQTWQHPACGQIAYRLWEPSHPTHTLIMVHGFGEHSGRYGLLAKAFAEQGIFVVCPDLVGHGRSTGRRGDIDRFDRYVDVLDAWATAGLGVIAGGHARAMVFGHSLGGLVTIHWALRCPTRFERLILQAPLLEVGFPVPPWKTRLAEWLTRYWPSLLLPAGLDPTWLSHDPTIVQAYREDPLVSRRISLRCYEAIQTAMRQAMERASQLKPPTLMLYGMEDRVVSVSACRTFFEQISCEKRLMEFPGCRHELHHEPAFPQVVEAVLRWIGVA